MDWKRSIGSILNRRFEEGEKGGHPPSTSDTGRPPMVAGIFYPSSAEELAHQVDDFLTPGREQRGQPLALISPHAGYVYSGGVAGAAFGSLAGHEIRRVVVVAPSHFERFDHSALFGGPSYETPLGRVPIDQEFVGRVADQFPSVIRSDAGHHAEGGRGEHAVEVLLPFLQRALPEFSLVPIVMGRQDFPASRDLARTLAREADGHTLVVASSDLSHYHPDDEARRRDGLLLDAVRRGDYFGLRHFHETGRCEACGIGPILVAMISSGLRGGNRVEVLRYATSGDVPPYHRDGVVGYLSALFSCQEDFSPPPGDLGQHSSQILEVARTALLAAASGNRFEPDPQPGLDEPAAVFVTLRREGELRGCVGSVVASEPLLQAVAEACRGAATGDLRFTPVAMEEVASISIDVSILGTFRLLEEVAEIQVGRDGLLVEKAGVRGLLLPQVAAERKWDALTFLGETCRKAGLDRQAWQEPDSAVYRFSAQVLRESGPPAGPGRAQSPRSV